MADLIYAEITGGEITNTVLVDSKAIPDWPDDGLDRRDITDNVPPLAIGWKLVGDAWVEPVPPVQTATIEVRDGKPYAVLPDGTSYPLS